MTKILITVEFMSAIRPADNQQKAQYTFVEPITLDHLLDSFGFQSSEKRHLMVVVNKRVQNSLEHPLEDGDEIFITLPIGGG
jgi:molybdopterin converting factor small subunit